MANSPLSFVSSSSFRDTLMARNLSPYNVIGVYTPPVSQTNYETVLSDFNVIDSPNELISNSPYANQAYPLNEYGPEGGFNQTITFNGPILPVNSNQGEYSPNETQMDLLNETFIDAAYIQNTYGPEGGYQYMVTITDLQLNNNVYQPYWNPPLFTPSTYSPYSILLSSNPAGSNGLLSQDSFLAKLGAIELKNAFEARVAAEIFQNTVGLVNLDSLQDPFEASLIATGQEPLIYRNWRITVPENPIVAGIDLATRLASAYWPVSPIPGDYFEVDNINGQTQQTSTALNVINQLTGGFLGPILNRNRTASEIFLANTGNGQRSVLFRNIRYNRYQPAYDGNFGGILGIGQGIVNLALDLINPNNGTLVGGYYVGSRNAEPSYITSPANQIPVNAFGQQDPSPVYGPSELGILYEGNQERLNFGLAGKSYTDGGSLDGGFVWTSPKYKGNAGFNATPGGGSGSADSEFNVVAGNYVSSESTNLTFKETSILDQTQRLIDSADNVAGINRLKHVGNAINQVSKVFNDGYKEITKGSKVLSYIDNTDGSQAGIEYCRIFTKDTPYLTYADLQKTDGITKSGRRFSYSVLDNTYNLNIAPLKNPGSTNIIKGAEDKFVAKKYMFSIENLAWRTSSKPGYTYDDLPDCEKGPNGGRVMWFPPYELTFNDSSSANWSETSFLGRPEPMYTYKDTRRTGSLNWKMIVDHPSIMNLIVNKQLKGVNKERVNSIIDSFFAGCTKYDLYQLGLKFNTIPTKDLFTYQEILNDTKNRDEIETIVNSVPADNNTDGTEPETNSDTSIDDFKKNYTNISFYFDNDIPGPSNSTTSSSSFGSLYPTYIGKESEYITKSNSVFKPTNNNSKVKEFFDNVVKYNYDKIVGEGTNSNFIIDAFNILKEGKGKIKIKMRGSASAVASVDYNKRLSQRRIDSVKQFLTNQVVGGASLNKYFEDKSIEIVDEAAKGEQDTVVFPITQSSFGNSVNCTENITAEINPNLTNNKIAEVYSVNAMACRRVVINDIEITPTPIEPIITDEPELIQELVTKKVPRKLPVKSVQEKLKEGIGKKILRQLLTECDYFEVIKEENPMIYDSIQDKVKYFNPAFHSMTPEGLNSRLTFLNQCVRPGETIPIIDDDGNPKFNDAINTSFGTPPVLVLRIGDFYNTKIIPKTISFTYEPLMLDMNPEGIGLQPMLAKVSLSFDFIGGQGLAKPVEELQNALSFNYYANTEVYDERATWTDDSFRVVDNELINAIRNTQSPVSVNNENGGIPNDGGNTIGTILSSVEISGGTNGEISYESIMDELLPSTNEYYNLILNKTNTFIDENNYGIWQLISKERKYINGDTNVLTGVKIFGKPENIEKRTDKLFEDLINDVNNDSNYLIGNLMTFNFSNKEIRDVKTNVVNYINNMKNNFNDSLFTNVNDIVNVEQSLVQKLRKINLVLDEIDGKIPDVGIPIVYNLTPTNDVSSSSNNEYTNTFEELSFDFKDEMEKINRYYEVIVQQKIITENGSNYGDTSGDFTPISTSISTIQDKRMFMVMSKIFSDNNKIEEFKSTIISGELKNNLRLDRKFRKVCNDFSDLVNKELKEEKKYIKNVKDNTIIKDILNEKSYVEGKTRKFQYTTVVDDNLEENQQKIKDLYSSVNVNNEDTWNGKIKFN
jgi:outer membrane protein OmpA-like peptidoglycan-associated protein